MDFLPGIIKGWCQSGYEAVTFFFVLSGFILTYVYSSSREDGSLNVPRRRFQIARLAEVGLAYYLALVLMLPAFIYGVAVAGIISLDRFVPATLAVPALLQAWLPPVAFSWNGPAWSLSVEMCFYASFPYLLLQTTRVARRDLVLAAAAAVVASAAIRANAQSLLPGYSTEWRSFFTYLPLFHVPSFVFGMALGRLFLFGRDRSPLGNQLSLVLASVVLALVLGFRSSLPAWFVSDALLVPLYGVVILAAAGMHSSTTGILASPVAVLAGEASYSMYILHTPVVFWWHWIAARSSDCDCPTPSKSPSRLHSSWSYQYLSLRCSSARSAGSLFSMCPTHRCIKRLPQTSRYPRRTSNRANGFEGFARLSDATLAHPRALLHSSSDRARGRFFRLSLARVSVEPATISQSNAR